MDCREITQPSIALEIIQTPGDRRLPRLFSCIYSMFQGSFLNWIINKYHNSRHKDKLWEDAKDAFQNGLMAFYNKSQKKEFGFASSNLPPASALLPDLQTVVPQHLQVVRAHQRDFLRFSNGVANTGDGPLQFKPEFPLGSNLPRTQNAIQQLLDTGGSIVHEENVSQFEYHPEHHHWHIDAVALFEIRRLSPSGPVVGGNSIKTTFCLIDWVKLNDNSNSKERMYFDCFGELQGISSGWVDQYNQAIDGQQLDISGVAETVIILLVLPIRNTHLLKQIRITIVHGHPLT